MILETVNLTKKIKEKIILDHVNIKIDSKGIFGIIGHNGAGKTTLFKLISGLIRPSDGEILLQGCRQQFGLPRTIPIAYLVDVPNQFDWMTIQESMLFYAQIVQLKQNESKKKIQYYLDYVGLKDNTIKISKLSRGMRQKLGIAQALLSDADILLLDEPTSALEPATRKDILELLKKISENKTICVSSHMLNDLERICDHIIILNKGKVVLQDTKKNLFEKYVDNRICIEIQNEKDEVSLFNGIKQIPGVSQIIKGQDLKYIVSTNSNRDVKIELLKYIVNQNIDIVSFQPYNVSLEDIYLRMAL